MSSSVKMRLSAVTPSQYHPSCKASIFSNLVTLRNLIVVSSSTGTFLNLFKSYNSEYTDGEQKRDFLYVKDAARITLFLLLEKKYGLFNLGRGIAETWNDLARALFKAMDLPVNIHYVDMPETLRPKYQYYTKAETAKLITAGYEDGFTSLENAIGEYVSLLSGAGFVV